MTKYMIRPMIDSDIPQMAEIEKMVFPTPWTEHAFRSELSDNALAVYLILAPEEEPDQVIGYGGMWQIFDEAHITNVAIHPDHQGKKLGRLLLHAMIQWAWSNRMSHMTLEVRPTNKQAIALYEKAGFRSVGRRPGYYEDNGEDAIIMWLHRKKDEEEQDDRKL